MKRHLKPYLVLLCIVLLSGDNTLHLNSSQDSFPLFSISTAERTGYSTSVVEDNDQTAISKSSSPERRKEENKQEAFVVEFEVEEDDRFSLFKKNSNDSKKFTVVSDPLKLDFFHSLINGLFSYQHSYQAPSYKWYLLFEVFRL